MVDRVGALKIPVTFIYGDNDWMDPSGGYKSVENLLLLAATETATDEGMASLVAGLKEVL